MTRHETPATSVAVRRTGAAIALAALAAGPVQAAEVKASGRLMAGNVYRVQDRDPDLLTNVNAPALGLMGYGNGSNADDGNTNYARGEAASRAIRALLDIAAADGNWSALVRIKAWHDAGMARDGRPWGNVVNGYGAGAPLSDSGMPRLSRFSGVALLDAWIEGRAVLAGMPVLARIGQQSTAWGERSMTPGGLEALNPRDMAGLHDQGGFEGIDRRIGLTGGQCRAPFRDQGRRARIKLRRCGALPHRSGQQGQRRQG